jgi:hypothetical protein
MVEGACRIRLLSFFGRLCLCSHTVRLDGACARTFHLLEVISDEKMFSQLRKRLSKESAFSSHSTSDMLPEIRLDKSHRQQRFSFARKDYSWRIPHDASRTANVSSTPSLLPALPMPPLCAAVRLSASRRSAPFAPTSFPPPSGAC